ncbi:hypothetical protein [Chromobacterium sp. IRSSSOUMB001]|uniref:AbiTii domain-containing protein n=1 Tax=Chromobacterium sp. IRSSSOUMB001 TaxID=2927123 RepID=UPI0020C0C8A0|nr:hypothetical protein [Chromobacterium sp. IRSSSOUMB001]
MTKSVVIELQELASSSANDIGDLLRKALMVATKLGLAEFRQWVLAELNGYTGELNENLPDYRIIHGELKAYNPARGLIPFQLPHQLHDLLTEIRVTESVYSLEQLLADKSAGTIVYNFPPEQEQYLMSMQHDYVQFRPTRSVGLNRLTAILGVVRTTILDWALALEADGILGEGLLFSESEKKAAMHNISIQNFQGILGNIDGGSSVTQSNSQKIMTDNFSSLERHLTENGVSKEDVDELEHALRHDPVPQSATQFGPKVSAWVGKMMEKAAIGGWDIGIATAGGLLVNALSKYYGLG